MREIIHKFELRDWLILACLVGVLAAWAYALKIRIDTGSKDQTSCLQRQVLASNQQDVITTLEILIPQHPAASKMKSILSSDQDDLTQALKKRC